jgi:hypothetical protein
MLRVVGNLVHLRSHVTPIERGEVDEVYARSDNHIGCPR